MCSRFKVKAFFKKFPFLVEGEKPLIKDPASVEQVHVKILNEEFLAERAVYDGATGSCVDIDDDKRVFLLDAEGKPLVEAKQDYYLVNNCAHQDNTSKKGESIGEALLRTDPKKVFYVVVKHTGYIIRNHSSVGGYTVTLLKLEEGLDLEQWVQKKLEEWG